VLPESIEQALDDHIHSWRRRGAREIDRARELL
jgi:hypothetical protein